MKQCHPHIIYSNRIESLYDELVQRLFADRTPFARRIVAVPTASVKGWLMQRMGSDPQLGIFAGVDVHLLDPALEQTAALVNRAPVQGNTTTRLQLALAIESHCQEIVERFHDLDDQEQAIWGPMIGYLGFPTPNGNSKKLRMLSSRLADLFLEYGRVGKNIFLGIHEQDRWQRALWDLLERTYDYWLHPSRTLAPPHIANAPEHVQLHLFAINRLTPLHHRYLSHVGKFIPTAHYVVSPCHRFWSDIVSDKERVRLERRLTQSGVDGRQIEELDEYLTDTNPLLANMGKLGRTQARMFEAGENEVFERYVLPLSLNAPPRYHDVDAEDFICHSEGPLTLLKMLQTDLLLLKNPHVDEKFDFQTDDRSIQLHSVPKSAREMDVVYNLLLEAMAEKDVKPQSIAVVAPDIREYVPFIHSAFGSQDSQIPYHILSTDSTLSNPTIQGFLRLLAIANSRWETSKILAIFHTKSFQRRHGLKKEEIALLETIVRDTGIRWGRCPKHRKELFGTGDHPAEYYATGTWLHGFGRVLEGFTMFDPSDTEEHHSTRFCPYDKVPYTQAEVVGIVMKILESLREDLAPMERGERRTVSGWTIYLKRLYEMHFSAADSETDAEGERILRSCIDELQKASKCIEGKQYTSSTIIYHLEKILEARGNHRPATNMQTVRFCSLSALGPLPYDIVVLVGMADGAFPKADRTPSFHLMRTGKWSEELHPRVDVERYQFLETVLSARSRLLITYPSQCGGDTSEHPPSSLVNDLFQYLDSACVIAGEKPSVACTRKHHMLPFHYSYFSPESVLKSYCQRDYDAAVAFYHKEKQQPPSFLPSLTDKGKSEIELSPQILLGDLVAFAKNPLSNFLKKSVGVYMPKEKLSTGQDEDPIVCPAYQRQIYIRKSLKSTPEAVLAHASRAGDLPKSPFKAVDIAHIYQEASTTSEILASKEISLTETFTLEFSEKYADATLHEERWQLPPLTIQLPEGPASIVGRIDNVHREGLLLFVEDDLKKAVEVWPQILVYCTLVDTHKLPFEKKVHFIKKGDVGEKSAENLDSGELLRRFVQYYLDSKHTPAPLMPDWIAAMLNGNHASIAKKAGKEEDDFSYPDEYLLWLNRRSSRIDWTHGAKHWSATASHVYLDLAKEWYPTTVKNVAATEDGHV